MRPPDPATLPGVALSGTDPAPERRPEWRVPPEWPVWTTLVVACLVSATGACAYAEVPAGWPTATALVLIYGGGAVVLGTTRVLMPRYARRANAAERAQVAAVNAISRATLDRVIMHGMAGDMVAFTHATGRYFEAHRRAGRLYEAEFWGRIILRSEAILCGKPT